MIKKKVSSKKSSTSTSEATRGNIEETLRPAQDRADDPLFVPHIEAFGISAERMEGNEDIYAELLESICGAADDSQPVERYNGTLGVTTAFVAAHQAPACQVQWNANLGSIFTNPGNVSGARWGSGTMITNDLFLTCGHLFDQTGGDWERPRRNGTTNIISPQEIAQNMHLNFNYQVDPAGNLRAEQSFPILQLIEYRLGGLDMAVCRIGGNPGATFGRTLISATDAAEPDMLCIIGHPAGLPKRIEAGPTFRIEGNLIRYNDIDTLGGNSGSGILRASDGRLVGVHTNGGCNAAGTGSNFGQRIAAVIASSPTLRSVLNPIPKRKFIDEVTKLKFSDDRIKLPVIDVKSPILDLKPVIDWSSGINRPGRFGQSVRFEAQSARPFILATPHHSNAWRGGAAMQQPEALAEIEAALVQLQQLMAAGEAELAQLEAEYRQLLSEYEAMGGAFGG